MRGMMMNSHGAVAIGSSALSQVLCTETCCLVVQGYVCGPQLRSLAAVAVDWRQMDLRITGSGEEPCTTSPLTAGTQIAAGHANLAPSGYYCLLCRWCYCSSSYVRHIIWTRDAQDRDEYRSAGWSCHRLWRGFLERRLELQLRLLCDRSCG